MVEFGQQELCVFHDADRLVPSSSPIEDASERRHYSAMLRQAYATKRAGFPGANPVSMDRADIAKLRERDYLVALKTDGVRYMLLMTKYDGEPRAVMIDRKGEMYEVEIWASEDFFDGAGTLFDGELVWERRGSELRLLFLLFDVATLKGESCARLRYSERLQLVHKHVLAEIPELARDVSQHILEQHIIDEDKVLAMCNLHDMHLSPKCFVELCRGQMLWERRGSSLHRNDGLIFSPDRKGLATGTDRDSFKWKPENTVDLRFDAGTLSAQSGGRPVAFERVLYNEVSLRVKLSKNQLLECLGDVREPIVECACRIVGDELHLFAIKHRTDRSTPNDISTIRATLRNIEEAIRVEELFNTGESSVSPGTDVDAATSEPEPNDKAPPQAGADATVRDAKRPGAARTRATRAAGAARTRKAASCGDGERADSRPARRDASLLQDAAERPKRPCTRAARARPDAHSD